MRVFHSATPTLILVAGLLVAGAAIAQQKSLGENFNGLQLRGDQPIAIESSQLDVNDKDAMATFTGNVSVAQGPTELRTGRLVVHYKRDGKGPKTDTAGGALPGASSSIERLEASEKVYVRSSDQTATADRASFDMDGQVVVMTGNVVLSRGDNVAQGCRLTIKMDTGVARLENGNCPGGKAANGRVRLMLTPGQGKN